MFEANHHPGRKVKEGVLIPEQVTIFIQDVEKALYHLIRNYDFFKVNLSNECLLCAQVGEVQAPK